MPSTTESILLKVNRRQNIADAALYLFAEKGYEQTPTLAIARRAGVSEALIFKHFGSKEQLLNYIIKDGYKRIVEHNRGMITSSDPLQLIHRIIDLPHRLVTEEPRFWKLQTRMMDINEMARAQHERFMQPVNALIVKAFKELGYTDPEQETTLLLLITEALWKTDSFNDHRFSSTMLAFIKAKYWPR